MAFQETSKKFGEVQGGGRQCVVFSCVEGNDPTHFDHVPKPQTGGKQADLMLTPLELIDRIAALVPVPRTHRHRYFGVLAPNSPLRAAVTALAHAVPVRAPQVPAVQPEITAT